MIRIKIKIGPQAGRGLLGAWGVAPDPFGAGRAISPWVGTTRRPANRVGCGLAEGATPYAAPRPTLLAFFAPAGRSLHLLAVVSPWTMFSYSPPTTVQAGFLGARRLSCPQGTSSASPVLALATPSSLCCCQPRVQAGNLCLVWIAVVLRAATASMARAGEAANARVWWLGPIYSRSCAGVKMRTGRSNS